MSSEFFLVLKKLLPDLSFRPCSNVFCTYGVTVSTFLLCCFPIQLFSPLYAIRSGNFDVCSIIFMCCLNSASSLRFSVSHLFAMRLLGLLLRYLSNIDSRMGAFA